MEYKIFLIYITAFNLDLDNKMHFLNRVQIAHLKVNEALIKVFSKYANFTNIFLLKLIVELSKYMGINNYIIKLVDNE